MTALLTLSPPDNAQEWVKSCGFASLKDASRFAGGQGKKSLDALSSPGKMPCHSYGLPAAECITGSKMRAADDTRYLAAYELAREAGKSHRAAHAIAKDTVENTCGGCYALKGQYVIGDVPAAQYRRLESLSWLTAMTRLERIEELAQALREAEQCLQRAFTLARDLGYADEAQELMSMIHQLRKEL